MENANHELSAEIEEVEDVPWGFRGTSSLQLRLPLGAWEKLVTGKVEIKHLERILRLPEDKACIIAASHVTDVDMPIIGYELGSYFNLVLANQSTQHEPFGLIAK